MKKIIIIMLSALLLIGCQQKSVDLTGYYEGDIIVGENKIAFNMDLSYDDTLSGSLNIPAQGLLSLPLIDTKVEEDAVSFNVALTDEITVSFVGTYKDDAITGTYTQVGAPFDFEMHKAEKQVYTNRETISEKIGDYTLTGELIVPEIASEMPVALIIAGSGPTDYNGNSLAGVSADSYLQLAEALEAKGIATLRYNKRILGNKINEEDLSFDDFVSDAAYFAEMLKKDPRFSDVVLIGHSQGALIAELVAQTVEVDKVVLLAGAGHPIDQVMLDQLTPQVDAATLIVVQHIFDTMRTGEIVTDIPPSLDSLLRESVQPFLMSWIAYDPVEELSNFNQPTLVVAGDQDLQVVEKEAKALMAGRDDLEYKLIEGMNHILKRVGTDINENYASYQNPDLPIHEGLVDVLIEFIE